MKKTLFLLLITLIQSQSDGVLLTGPNHGNKLDSNNEKIQSDDWDNSGSSSTSDVSKVFSEKFQPYRKRNDNLLTRRSILDKTFMRFGRTNEHECQQKGCRTVRSSFYEPEDYNFQRDDRGMRDSFIRFGRRAQDNFIRFGRGARDNFIRFGRGARDHFIRFGRDGTDIYYPIDPEEFAKVAKRLRDSAFIRFGRSDLDSFIRFGKLDQNFIRFGRGNLNKDWIGRDYDGGMPEKSEGTFMKFGHKESNPSTGTGFRGTEGSDVTSFTTLSKQREVGEGGEGSEDKQNSDFVGDNRDDANSGMVIRIKRKATEKEAGEGEAKTKGEEKEMGKNLNDSGESDSSKFKVLNRRSTGYFVEKIPGFFPQNFPPRLQSYAKSWDDLDNGRDYDYTGANPPYFPISSNI